MTTLVTIAAPLAVVLLFRALDWLESRDARKV